MRGGYGSTLAATARVSDGRWAVSLGLSGMLGGMLRTGVRRLVGALIASGLLLFTAGCGGAPGTIGPSGVDELTIPTPDPDPADFVAAVDNPWFPLPTDARWTYAVRQEPDDPVVEVTHRVTGAGPDVAGVPTTQVVEVSRDDAGRQVARSRSWYAQDRSGNVWIFGREVERSGQPVVPASWRAGEGGAEAGLAMPAAPRVGDGFWVERVPEGVQLRARVEAVDATLGAAGESWTNVVVLTFTAGSTEGAMSYAPGVGLLSVEAGAGGMELAEVTGVPGLQG